MRLCGCVAGYAAIEVASKVLAWTNANIFKPASSRLSQVQPSVPDLDGEARSSLSQPSGSSQAQPDTSPSKLEPASHNFTDMSESGISQQAEGYIPNSSMVNGDVQSSGESFPAI